MAPILYIEMSGYNTTIPLDGNVNLSTPAPDSGEPPTLTLEKNGPADDQDTVVTNALYEFFRANSFYSITLMRDIAGKVFLNGEERDILPAQAYNPGTKIQVRVGKFFNQDKK